MESKKVEFFNRLSFITLLLTLFLSIFFFIPYVPVAQDATKGFLISIGATLSLLFWLISRLGDGRFVFPKDKLLLFGLVIPIVFLISSFFSSSLYVSLFGSGFEIGTFGSMLVMFIIFFLSSIYFQSEKRLWYFIGSLLISGLIVIIFELVNIVVGFENILPGFLQSVTYGNLVGSWNNFALILGLLSLVSLFTIELLKTKGWLKILQYVLLVFSLLFLIIVNIPFVWLLVGVFSIIIFVYITSIERAGVRLSEGQADTHLNKKFPFASLVVVFISIIFLIGSNLIGGLVSKYISVNSTEVRPSIVTTSQIAYKAFLHNPLFGTGPNTFSIDWALWQPKQITETIFWNVDFNVGFSLLTTFLATVGLVGFLVVLAFIVIYIIRGIQSIKVALQNRVSNYFIITILMISIYSWLTVVFYSPNIVIIALAFVSSGALLGALVFRKAIPVKDFSFLSDPRNSFFSILGLVVLMIASIALSYIYIEKFSSIIYFSKGLNDKNNTAVEILGNAENMISKAITLDKNDIYYRTLSQIYLNEINILISSKDISEDTLKSELQQLINLSQQSAENAVAQNPKQYLNYVNLGNIYTALVPLSVTNSYESAIAAYNQASLLAPNNASILLAKASLEYINKNNSEARKYINQALELKRNYIDAIFLLVQIETNEGNLSEAIKQAEYAGDMAPNDPTVFFRLGLLRYNNSDYSGAVSAFEKAVILDNTYVNARYFLGQSYKKVGRTEDALKQFEILDKMVPDNKEIKDAMSSINQPTTTNEDENKDNKSNTETTTKPPLEEKGN